MNYISFIVLILFTISTGFSQVNNFRTYSIDKGLSQSTVYCIMQDDKGFLWLGTDGGGACVFDGNNFQVYNKKTGLSGNIVRALFQDSKKNIWIGTDEGISVYNGYIFQAVDSTVGLGNGSVLKLIEDKSGNIWAATDNGLYKIAFQNGKFQVIKRISSKDGLVTNFIFDIYSDENKLWLALYGGINIITFEKDTFLIQTLNTENYLPSNIITCIEKDHKGNLWFGSYDAGAFKLNPNNISRSGITLYNTDNYLNDNTVWDILSDNGNNIWICTNNSGVYKYNSNEFSNLSEQFGLPNNQILCAFEDFEHNIWFGTMGSGLIKHNGEHFSHFLINKGFLSEQVSRIRQANGYYWLGTFGEGLIKMKFISDTSKYEIISDKNGLANNIVNDIFISGDNVWVATQNGLSILNKSGIQNIYEQNGLPDNRINCILIDKKGLIWIGTGAGLSIFNNGAFVNITKDSEYGIPNDDIQTIIEDNLGRVWVGTLSGLIMFNEGQMTTYDEAEGLNDKSIHSLTADKNNNIWIGTYGGGLYYLDTKTNDKIKIKQIAGNDILSSINVYSLIFENENTLIVGTDKGFDKLFFDKDNKIIKAHYYDRTNGFIGVENKLNSILKDSEGNIWFGTILGLTKYSPLRERENTNSPIVHLTSIELFFEKTDWSQYSDSIMPRFGIPVSLVLPYDKNHITFKFNAISLTNPEKVRYKYILEGLDKNWSPERIEPEVVYSGLPPGSYVFKVIAVGENGIWSEKPITFEFTIDPPFWKTKWFIISMIILIMALGYIYIKIRERNLKQEKKILEEKVRERTRELAEKNIHLEKARNEIKEQHDIVLNQRDEIAHQKKELTDSIHYAVRIQRAVLPDSEFFKLHLPNSFVLFRPHSMVSGDFYWATRINNIVIFTAADCTGHGVPGAFMSMLGMSFLNEIVRKSEVQTASDVLNKLRENVVTALRQRDVAATSVHSSGMKDGMDISLCALNIETKECHWAGANNPLYIVRKSTEEIGIKPVYELEELKPDKMPIAIYEKMDSFTNNTIQLKNGDTLYLFSDGFADQFGGPKGKKFMYKKFKELLVDISEKKMDDQRDTLEKAIIDWMAYTDETTGKPFDQIDDILVMGVRIS